MRKLTLPILISSALLTQSAFAGEPNRAISYLTSWGVPAQAEKEMQRSNIDTLLLSFGQWDANGNIQISDSIATIPTNLDWIPSDYLSWTQFKLADPKRKIMVAFGGQTYESIWGYLSTAESREKIAQSLANLLAKDYPVFERVGSGPYKQVGTVQLDGIDFDFEKAARVTPGENENLLDLAKRLKQKIAAMSGKKLLSLTTYHVGADPENCANPAVIENCSYVEPARSSHHGEVLPILQTSRDVFDFFNVMAYDAGPRFKYEVAMENYANAVGDKSKIVLGATINSQWGPDGNFVESYHNNIERAAWQSRNNYGGFFVWTLGSNTQSMHFAEQVNYLNDMKDAADENSGNKDTEKPSIPSELKAKVNNGNISLTWEASTDNVGVVGYQIYRNDVNYSTTTGTQWQDPFALPDVEYRYRVKAKDAAGNLSDASNEVVAKIDQSDELIKPNTPSGLQQVSATKSSLKFEWAPVTNVTIKQYHISRDNVAVKTVVNSHFEDTGLNPGTTYRYSVIAESDKGQMSDASIALKAQTNEDNENISWNYNDIYHAGDVVSWKGKNYKAKWWTQNNEPGASDVWENLDSDVGGSWNAQNVYYEGNEVSYQDKTWVAKWWTRGDVPGENDVWKLK